MSEYEIYHHGIKGMKWGRRRYQNKDGTLTAEGRKRYMSDDAREAKRIGKKKVSEMSNAELRKYNERVNLERQYANLNPSAAKKGMKFVKGAAATLGTALTLYNNSDKVVKLGQKVGSRIVDRIGDMVVNDLRKNL